MLVLGNSCVDKGGIEPTRLFLYKNIFCIELFNIMIDLPVHFFSYQSTDNNKNS
jgi:hypothetical protein